jgi:hypothetical protein
VTHVPTSIRGCHVSSTKLGLSAFDWEFDEAGNPSTVRCPGGQQVTVRRKNKRDRFIVDFEAKLCEQCPWKDQCRAEQRKKRPVRALYVSAREAQVARLRRRCVDTRGKGKNWRAAVESTVRSVTHPFGGQTGKLPVRGQPRVTQVIFCSAFMVNLRRIWRYERELAEKANEKLGLLLLFGFRSLRSWCHGRSVRRFPAFGLIPAKS